MKRFHPYVFLLVLMLMASCVSGNDHRIRIDITRALKQNWSINDLCSGMTACGFDLSAQPDFVIPPKPVISVSKGMVCILDSTASRIGVFDTDGVLTNVVDVQEKVTDFFVYDGKLIDALTERGVSEFSLPDGRKLNFWEYLGIADEYKAIGRRDGGYIHLMGISGSRLVDNSIILSYDKRLKGVINPIATAADAAGKRFFECNDALFFNYSTSGMVVSYKGDDFIFPEIEWDFGRYKGEQISPLFTNAQKTGRKYYFTVNFRGEDYLLVYNGIDGRYKVIGETREGLRLPLGVISDGVDYYVCNADEAGRYLGTDQSGTDEKVILLKCVLAE